MWDKVFKNEPSEICQNFNKFVFIVNFEHFLYFFLLPLLTLNKQSFDGSKSTVTTLQNC